MEEKIILYDSNNVKVGEAFMRRARQLVNQQRAEWTDETHTAIRFAPDVEEWEPAKPAADSVDKKDADWLYSLAKRRVRSKRTFILHSILWIPVYGIIYGFFDIAMVTYSYSERVGPIAFFCGAWTAMYVIHCVYFYLNFVRNFDSPGRGERKKRAIEEEVARLKKMGYTE